MALYKMQVIADWWIDIATEDIRYTISRLKSGENSQSV
jgi:hypothetical protein